MVAGDVDHLGAALAHGQQAADHVGVGLRPVHPAAQFPAVDDVAHQVDAVGVVLLEEARQVLGLAVAGAEVDIGDPQGTHALLAGLGLDGGFQAFDAAHGRPPAGFRRW
ncbi:hypothetical protein D9M71_726960 [compost metagenome]